MPIAEAFYRKTGKRYVYNITSISNIPSILKHGILCYDATKNLPHRSIAINTVQSRREHVVVPNGRCLHSYANLYFDYNNAMLYRRKDLADTICVLAISADILDVEGCVVTDRNAATDLVRFYAAGDGIRQINFEMVYAQYWNHPDPYEYSNHKAIKCAEVLIPYCVPPEYIIGAYVVSEDVKKQLMAAGFDRRIVVSPKVFYR